MKTILRVLSSWPPHPSIPIAALLGSFLLLEGARQCEAQQTNTLVQFSSSVFLVDENKGPAVIAVTRSGVTTNAVTVDYATGNGLATPGVDYTPQTGTLSFAPGETSKTFSIPIFDDSVPEGSETVQLALTKPTGGAILGTQATARLYIMDNENRGTLVDFGFNGAISPSDFISSIVVQSDGKIIASGNFARSDSSPPDRILRFNSDGSRDKSFTALIGGTNNSVYSLAMQPDGKLIVGGAFTRVGTVSRGMIARLNSDGSLDQSFDPGNGVSGSVAPGVFTIVLQKDGKVLLGGSFDTVNSFPRNAIARLNTNGSLDTNFNPGAGISTTDANFLVAWISAIAVQTDGKVIIAGQFTSVDAVGRLNIARLNSDGAVDATFDPGTSATGTQVSIEAVALQLDGKILIGGDFTKFGDVPRNALARLNTDGSLDAAFDTGGGVKDRDANGTDTVGLVTSLAVQPDGKILFSGLFLTYDEINRHGIGRINTDATLDGTFGPYLGTTYRNDLGYEEIDSVTTMALQSDGNILIGGSFLSADGSRTNRFSRLLSTNVRTSSFEFSAPSSAIGESGGLVSIKVIRRGDSSDAFTVDYATTNITASLGTDYRPLNGTLRFNSMEVEKTISVPILDDALAEDNETFAVFLRNPSAGSTLGSPSNHVVKIIDSKKPGNLDFSFAELNIPFPGDPVSFLPVTAIAVQPNGQVIISGHFISVNGSTRRGVVRVNVDGTLDPTFVPQIPTGTSFLDFHQMGIQPDGGIVGGFDGVYRLNSDGTLDTRFAPDVGSVNALTVQTDGKILVSDEFFDPIAGVNVDEVSRFLANGAFDTSFTSPQLDDWVNSIAAQPDGKVVIGGYFTQVNGTAQNRIARLNIDGSLDSTFNIGLGFQGTNAVVYVVALQPDGKAVVGGSFAQVNGLNRNYIVRFNTDGSVDKTFDPGTGPNGYVESIAVQRDGKIYIGGNFTTYNGVGRTGFARLNSNGSLDQSFQADLTFDVGISVASIVIQSDGKILIGGLFTAVNGAPREGVARLNGDDGSLRLSVTAPKPAGSFRLTLATQPGNQYRIDASSDLFKWSPISTNLSNGFTLDFVDPNAGDTINRFYRAMLLGP